jgi:hypothetical protein
VQPSFNRLRGLQELVAVSTALHELEKMPSLSYWMERYLLTETHTPKETKVLRHRYDGKRGWFDVSGGVHLTALAMRLNAGDVMALRESVVKIRPSSDAFKWEFLAAGWLVSLEPGQIKSEDAAPLLQQAYFLIEQKRYLDALSICDQILAVAPYLYEGLIAKVDTLWRLDRFEEMLI